jgi:hypothetical protein
MTRAPKQFHRQHRLAQAKREVFENWFLIIIKKKKKKEEVKFGEIWG